MRLPLLLLTLLTGCVGFHPYQGERAPAPGDAVLNAVWMPEWQEIGRTVQDRPIRKVTLGSGPRRVLWVGGIHGNEREGRIATAELPRLFRETSGALDKVTLTILEDINPDGSAANTRGNANGVDLNRNYPAGNFKPSAAYGKRPLDQPESRILHDLIDQERPHLVIVAHSWRDDHFINFDGPAAHLAQRFSTLSGYRVQPSDEIAPTPGSLGSWVGLTLGIPILTLEYLRGRDAWEAWIETKSAILSVILEG
jgi:hypothetical protein